MITSPEEIQKDNSLFFLTTGIILSSIVLLILPKCALVEQTNLIVGLELKSSLWSFKVKWGVLCIYGSVLSNNLKFGVIS